MSMPLRHLSPTQQPEQLDASHLLVLQTRVTVSHVRPWTEQSVQAWPERPQACGSLPARQVLVPPSKLQQPPGQSPGPQLG